MDLEELLTKASKYHSTDGYGFQLGYLLSFIDSVSRRNEGFREILQKEIEERIKIL